MTDNAGSNDVFRFDDPGTLPKPGLIGRFVRLFFGALCLSLVWNLAIHGGAGDLMIPGYWVWAIFALVLVPYVVNIGFGVRWASWPRWASLGLLGLGGIISLAATGSPLGKPLWLVVNGWMIYVYGHLGVSFGLSAVLATPGCELRAIPHVLGLLGGRDAREHYCPGFIDAVDRWERGDWTPGEAEEKDLLASPGRLLLLYGLPFVALQLAGNLGGPLVGNGVPALALLFVGGLCALNALRCRRVHCVLLAPIFLVAGFAMILYTVKWIDFGPGTWPLIVNSALAAGFVVGCFSEHLLGRYWGTRRS